MSIARGARQVRKVCRTLMFSAAVHLLHIKDLKDLSVFRSARFYRHAGPKGPEEVFFTGVIAGDRPPRYGKKWENLSLASIRDPGPVGQDRLILTCL